MTYIFPSQLRAAVRARDVRDHVHARHEKAILGPARLNVNAPLEQERPTAVPVEALKSPDRASPKGCVVYVGRAQPLQPHWSREVPVGNVGCGGTTIDGTAVRAINPDYEGQEGLTDSTLSALLVLLRSSFFLLYITTAECFFLTCGRLRFMISSKRVFNVDNKPSIPGPITVSLSMYVWSNI